MDKKKVIELIKKGMLYQSKSSHVSSYKEKAKNCFEEALNELQKSDWISIEEDLPPYDKVVWVTSKMSPDNVFKNRRVECTTVPKDSNDFIILWKGRMARITHWKPIEKLEE